MVKIYSEKEYIDRSGLPAKVLRIIGVPIYTMKISKGWRKHKYLLGLLKIREKDWTKEYYSLGIRIFRREDKFKKLEILNNNINNKIIKNINEKYEILNRKIDDIFYNASVLTQVPIIHKYFGNYKRIHENENIIIFACGPTVNIYDNEIEGKYIGINGAVRIKDDLDYLFLTDKFVQDATLNEEIDAYKGNNCKKFYSVLPLRRTKGIDSNRLPQINLYNSNANIFMYEDAYESKWAVELEVEAFGDFGGTVFAALQFALYTHPKKIYLVGCDCSNGYAYSSNINYSYSHQIRHYEMFKNFVAQSYPDVEIISVNPIGLKGMFKDVYTQKYLDQNLDVKMGLGSNMEVLAGVYV